MKLKESDFFTWTILFKIINLFYFPTTCVNMVTVAVVEKLT
jgi:hypothetical protein